MGNCFNLKKKTRPNSIQNPIRFSEARLQVGTQGSASAPIVCQTPNPEQRAHEIPRCGKSIVDEEPIPCQTPSPSIATEEESPRSLSSSIFSYSTRPIRSLPTPLRNFYVITPGRESMLFNSQFQVEKKVWVKNYIKSKYVEAHSE